MLAGRCKFTLNSRLFCGRRHRPIACYMTKQFSMYKTLNANDDKFSRQNKCSSSATVRHRFRKLVSWCAGSEYGKQFKFKKFGQLQQQDEACRCCLMPKLLTNSLLSFPLTRWYIAQILELFQTSHRYICREVDAMRRLY